MDMPGGSTTIRRDADIAAANIVGRLARSRRAENIDAAVTIHHMYDLLDLRLSTEAAIFDRGHIGAEQHGVDAPDVYRARLATECEAAASLSLSRVVTRDMLTVAEHLAWRLPAIDAAFTAGDLDYPRVRKIVLTLLRASEATVAALEADILAVARRSNTRALGERIWKLWIKYAPKEAEEALKKAESDERCADIRRGENGLATLIAKMSALEGSECDAVLDELAATVCSGDPRTTRQLRSFALLALVHREDSIACTCGTDDCPVKDAPREPRRKPLLQIKIDIETLLGLTNNPPTLADGTVLHPDTVRFIAEDARWQGLLSEMLTAATSYLADQDDNDDRAGKHEMPDEGSSEMPDEGSGDKDETSDAGNVDGKHGQTVTPDADNSEGGTAAHRVTGTSTSCGGAGDGAQPTQRPGPRAERLLRRGRIRAAAPLPAPASTPPRSTSLPGDEVALSKAISDFLRAAAADPSLLLGPHPDGHGEFTQPPPGALTYRPSAELVALTRASYSTCTFHGCTVPAARCDIDHIVPFDKQNPLAGGWTILANLHPLCTFHHHAKTIELWRCAKLTGDAIAWTSTSGVRRITLPTYGTVMIPDQYRHTSPYRTPNAGFLRTSAAPGAEGPASEASYCTDLDVVTTPTPTPPDLPPPPNELYEPTWWEQNITDAATEWAHVINPFTAKHVPTLADIARLVDPQARADAIFLRKRFLEHRAIIAEREKYRKPPF